MNPNSSPDPTVRRSFRACLLGTGKSRKYEPMPIPK